ncbi:MAG: hypothetical protein H6581_24050 [Bacteroidia bacterium]|nr:hypothetical protein [Bacteroidia bacterium]
MRITVLFLILILIQMGLALKAQVNMLKNPGFEGDSTTIFPQQYQTFFDIMPPDWEDFNDNFEQEGENWYCDFVCSPGQDGCTNYATGTYYSTCEEIKLSVTPSAHCGAQDTVCNYLKASEGRFFIGMNYEKGFVRQGIQQQLQTCNLNSGDYKFSYKVSVPYNCDSRSFFIYLSKQKNKLSRRIGKEWVYPADMKLGKWKARSLEFTLDQHQKKDQGLQWFVLTHREGGISEDYRKYLFFDDLNLHRPCDTHYVCYSTFGQICPTIGTPPWPQNPLVIKHLENATDITIKLYQGSKEVTQFAAHNANGLPEVRWPDANTLTQLASSYYRAQIEIWNECGGIFEEKFFFVGADPYTQAPDFQDSTATWSKVPEPCCLETLTLSNTVLTGNLEYIVREKIVIGENVSVQAGSNIYLQAREVVNIQNLQVPTSATVEVNPKPCN